MVCDNNLQRNNGDILPLDILYLKNMHLFVLCLVLTFDISLPMYFALMQVVLLCNSDVNIEWGDKRKHAINIASKGLLKYEETCMFSKMFSDVKANDAPMVLGIPIGLLTDLLDRNHKPWGSYSKYLWRRQLYPYGIVLMSGSFSLKVY